MNRDIPLNGDPTAVLIQLGKYQIELLECIERWLFMMNCKTEYLASIAMNQASNLHGNSRETEYMLKNIEEAEDNIRKLFQDVREADELRRKQERAKYYPDEAETQTIGEETL